MHVLTISLESHLSQFYEYNREIVTKSSTLLSLVNESAQEANAIETNKDFTHAIISTSKYSINQDSVWLKLDHCDVYGASSIVLSADAQVRALHASSSSSAAGDGSFDTLKEVLFLRTVSMFALKSTRMTLN